MKNTYNNTPLHLAALEGKLDVVKFFIEDLGIEADIRGQFGRIPLHYASENGQLDVVQYLVDIHHCDPLCPAINQITPMDLALSNNHLHIVSYFLTKVNLKEVLLREHFFYAEIVDNTSEVFHLLGLISRSRTFANEVCFVMLFLLYQLHFLSH